MNVDNNSVGWYHSMHFGSICSTSLIENQFAFQESLSDNSVVIFFDPAATSIGTLVLKAYRLSQGFMATYRRKENSFIKPSEIFEEVPIYIRNPGLINAFLFDLHVMKDRA